MWCADDKVYKIKIEYCARDGILYTAPLEFKTFTIQDILKVIDATCN